MPTHLPLRIRAIKGLLLLAGFFLIGLFVAALMGQTLLAAGGEGTRSIYLLTSAAQGLLAFCLPAWLAAKYAGMAPASYLRLDGRLTLKAVAGIVVAYMLAMPALNQIIAYNAAMHLPESMQGFEATLRSMEEANGKMGEMILNTPSVGGLVSGVLIVGVLTGFCEEIFFRGAMQHFIKSAGAKPWLAVVVTAVIFSVMHFQFFGFVPRLLLGAFFGFLLLRSCSLWTAVTAHALNNSLVVITAWLSNRGIATGSLESLGVATDGTVPWLALASAIATALFIIYFSNIFWKPYSETK